jgi:EAL domain-containing protein (putative c-di-GMP-specific phosphodiesterase class I)/GGDEF domain-containing protein
MAPGPLPCLISDFPDDYYQAHNLASLTDAARRTIQNGKAEQHTIIIDQDSNAPENVLAIRALHSPMAGDRGLLVLHDISDEVSIGREYRRQSRQDQETGLLNAIGIEEAVQRQLDLGALGGLVAIKLDQLERIERVLGPNITTDVLATCITRIRDVLPSGTDLGRLRFMTLLAAIPSDGSDLAEVAAAIAAALDRPFHLHDRFLHVGGHCGVSVAEPHVTDAHELVQRARKAAITARELHVATIDWQPELDLEPQQRLDLLGGLDAAMQQHELAVVHQPIVNPNGQLLGAEALTRWHHPVHRLIPPSEFIDLVETSTLAMPFTAHILRRALERFLATGLSGRCGVNVPPTLLTDPGFLPMVLVTLDEVGAAPEQLCLEITERGLVDRGERVRHGIARLREHGICVSMDDFGTGSTSLAHLEALGFDSIKIDRSIIEAIDTDPVRQAIVASVVNIAGTIGATVIAEGVETHEEMTMCTRLGVTGLQGYAIERPADIAVWSDRFHRTLPPPTH